MKCFAVCNWNEDIEAEWGGPIGPRILYPKNLEEGEIKEALAEIAPGWDGDWSLQVTTDSGRYAAPLVWVGGEEVE